MKELKADVAVVAAGPAGLCAAAAAAEKGAKVLVFEKSKIVGGTANMGMGLFGVESRIQRKSMIQLTKETAFRRFMDYVHWKADARLVRDYIWRSGNTIDWLEDMGVRFSGAAKNFPASEPTWHIVMPEKGERPGPGSASAMNKAIYRYAMERGAEFFFSTPVDKLIVEDGMVTGLTATAESGEKYQVCAGAVIIATGGFGSNPEMVKEYTGYTWGRDIFNRRLPHITGDGCRMAWAAGAGKGRMDMELVVGQAIPGAGAGKYPQTYAFRQACPIALNKSGFRVCDESIMQNASVGANVISIQPDKSVFMILNDGIIEHFQRDGVDFPSEVFQSDPTAGFDAAWRSLEKEYPDIAFTAASPEELAQKTGMPAKELMETLNRYNGFCAQNYDDDFGKDRRYLKPIAGRLYAYKLVCGAYGSLGGIKINHRFEAVTDSGVVIPGLYGAGSDVCSIYGGTYYYYFPGNTMGFAVNSGRMSGEYAADFVCGRQRRG